MKGYLHVPDHLELHFCNYKRRDCFVILMEFVSFMSSLATLSPVGSWIEVMTLDDVLTTLENYTCNPCKNYTKHHIASEIQLYM